MTRFWVAAGAVIVLAGAVLIYVFTSGTEQPEAAPPPKPAPTLTPLEYGSEAIWSTPEGVWRVDARDGVAVYEHDSQLVVVDAVTGVPRWQVGDFKPLPGGTGLLWRSTDSNLGPRLVEHDSGLAVLTGYDSGNEVVEQGLALLSAADGRVLWHTPLRGEATEEVFDLRAVDDRIAVTTDRTGETEAVAIRSGKRLWTRPATDAKAIAGDVVLVQGWDPDPSPTGKLLSQVTALDLSTGAVRWDLTDRYDGSEVLAGGEDNAQVRARTGSKAVGKLLATGDGHELADVDGEGRCASGDGLLACPGVDGVVVRDLTTGAVTETGVSAFRVDRVQDGRFHLERDDRVWTIDAAGNVIDERLPGELTTITDEMVCFTLSRSFSVACHALG